MTPPLVFMPLVIRFRTTMSSIGIFIVVFTSLVRTRPLPMFVLCRPFRVLGAGVFFALPGLLLLLVALVHEFLQAFGAQDDLHKCEFALSMLEV